MEVWYVVNLALFCIATGSDRAGFLFLASMGTCMDEKWHEERSIAGKDAGAGCLGFAA
jgi:hypothetical protein